MATDILVGDRIGEGERLLREIDDLNLPATAAFWYLDPNSDAWRYYVATPLVENLGPRRILEAIQPLVRSRYQWITLSDIRVVSPRDPLVVLLRSRATTDAAATSAIRVTREVINNVYVEDAYIYRMA